MPPNVGRCCQPDGNRQRNERQGNGAQCFSLSFLCRPFPCLHFGKLLRLGRVVVAWSVVAPILFSGSQRGSAVHIQRFPVSAPIRASSRNSREGSGSVCPDPSGLGGSVFVFPGASPQAVECRAVGPQVRPSTFVFHVLFCGKRSFSSTQRGATSHVLGCLVTFPIKLLAAFREIRVNARRPDCSTTPLPSRRPCP